MIKYQKVNDKNDKSSKNVLLIKKKHVIFLKRSYKLNYSENLKEEL